VVVRRSVSRFCVKKHCDAAGVGSVGLGSQPREEALGADAAAGALGAKETSPSGGRRMVDFQDFANRGFLIPDSCSASRKTPDTNFGLPLLDHIGDIQVHCGISNLFTNFSTRTLLGV